MFEAHGIIRAPISPYHAQVDPVERVNQSLKMLSMYVQADYRGIRRAFARIQACD